MKRWSTFLPCLAVALGAGGLLGGCSTPGPSFVHPAIDFGYMERAAVLPFRNLTADELADERVQSIFLMEILAEDVLEILDTREARAALDGLGIKPGVPLTPEQAVGLGNALQVDALFFGTVEEYGVSRSDRSRGSEVTVTLEMIETQTGEVVWRAQAHRTGATLWKRLFGGAPSDLYTVSRDAIRAALGTLLE